MSIVKLLMLIKPGNRNRRVVLKVDLIESLMTWQFLSLMIEFERFLLLFGKVLFFEMLHGGFLVLVTPFKLIKRKLVPKLPRRILELHQYIISSRPTRHRFRG